MAVTDFAAQRAQYGIARPVVDGDRLVFVADDGIHGPEIWEHRAGEATAHLVADTCPGPCSLIPWLLAVDGDAVFFVGSPSDSSGGPRPFVVDGAGVRQLADVTPAYANDGWMRVGDRLYFAGTFDVFEQELWVIDLPARTARRLTSFLEPFAFGYDYDWGRLGNVLLFGADDGIHGNEPWRSDGTVAGTRLLADLVGSDLTPTGPPAVPQGLVVQQVGESAFEVSWAPVAGAQSYELDVRSPVDLEPTPGDGGVVYLAGLDLGTPVTVRVRAVNAFGTSAYSDPVSATIASHPPGEPCVADDATLCLRQGKFRIEVAWRNQHGGGHGAGRALPAAGSDRSGYFWFFKPDNVELIVKLLDGTGSNGYWWTFYGALSDVEYWVTVTDTVSSGTRTYHNPPGQICGRGDTAALAGVRVPPAEAVRLPMSDPESGPFVMADLGMIAPATAGRRLRRRRRHAVPARRPLPRAGVLVRPAQRPLRNRCGAAVHRPQRILHLLQRRERRAGGQGARWPCGRRQALVLLRRPVRRPVHHPRRRPRRRYLEAVRQHPRQHLRPRRHLDVRGRSGSGVSPVFRHVSFAALAVASVCCVLGGVHGEAATPAPTPAYVPVGSNPSAFHELSNVTVFFAWDGDPNEGDQRGELWRTDGTAAGTVPLGACDGACGLDGIAVGGSRQVAFYWIADTQLHYDLWRTDGTAAGTVRLTDYGADTWGVRETESQFTWNAQSGRLLYWVPDLVHETSILWVSDGTPAGTRAVFAPPAGRFGEGRPVVAGSHFVFVLGREASSTSLDSEVWSTDGTTAGTKVLVAIPDFEVLEMVQTRFGTLFSGRPYSGGGFPCPVQLWASGGTAATTAALGEFGVYTPNCNTARLELQGELGDGAYFVAGLPDDPELWTTDGSPAGTRALTDFASRPQNLVGGALAEWKGGVYVAARDVAHGNELYRVDAGGITLVADVCPGACSANPMLVLPTETHLFFDAGDYYVNQPWMTDGTAAGTRVRPGCGGCRTQQVPQVRIGDHIFLYAWDPDHQAELWSTRITDGSMRRLTDLPPPVPIGDPRYAGRRGDLMLFSADDGIHGWELWRSDGTAAGTFLLRDLSGADDTPTGPPARPQAPVVTPIDGTYAEISWSDVPGATRYRIEIRTPDGVQEGVVEGYGYNGTGAGPLSPGTPVTVRVRAENFFGVSPWSEEASATTPSTEPLTPCTPSADVLCLWGDRFRVEVDWHDQHNDKHGIGHTVPALGSDRSGHFWFFKPDNLELIVKVLDGTSSNGFWWSFYGALTDVEYWITVTDTRTDAQRTYHNPEGRICGRGDTASLAALAEGLGGTASAGRWIGLDSAFASAAEPREEGATLATAAASGPCVADAETLCLLDGRFRVTVDWQDQHNHRAGSGAAVPFTDRTGLFTFFNPSNVELVVKALDGRPVNGKLWIFYGALTDVGYTITIEDLVDGTAVRHYVNTPGELCGRGDTAAF